MPAICSNRSALGSTERYRSDETAPDAWARAATLASNWAPLKQTPLGFPVVPDVKMIRLASSAGTWFGKAAERQRMDFDTEARRPFEVLGIGDNLGKLRGVDDMPDLGIRKKVG